ncbi:MAG TPA: DUF177 domain-containing protein [Bacteroidales bacterium]|nr:DUF177 domain-containing protein [Bacteroidales bacterium]HRZ21473.1 DUF177 domain-containing protein [Bacteroidales bacterium]
MSYADPFVIPFSGLKPGIHEYEFFIDDEFFRHFEYSQIKAGKVTVDLEVEKQETMLVLNFAISGTVHVMCDRCLDYYDQPIGGTERLIIKFGETSYEETDEIVVIPGTEHRINVRHYIYEYIHLLLPYKCVHPNDEEGISLCNPEVTGRLGQSSKEDEAADPRWDELKKLL